MALSACKTTSALNVSCPVNIAVPLTLPTRAVAVPLLKTSTSRPKFTPLPNSSAALDLRVTRVIVGRPNPATLPTSF
jgi:hypothetical protein